jgi:hypothetical protein
VTAPEASAANWSWREAVRPKHPISPTRYAGRACKAHALLQEGQHRRFPVGLGEVDAMPMQPGPGQPRGKQVARETVRRFTKALRHDASCERESTVGVGYWPTLDCACRRRCRQAAYPATNRCTNRELERT